MARGRRQRKQLVADESLIADFDLALDDSPLPPDNLSSDKVSEDLRRLHRQSVPLPSSAELHCAPLLPDTLLDVPSLDPSLRPGLFDAEDPFFTPAGLDGNSATGEGDSQGQEAEQEERAMRYMSSVRPCAVAARLTYPGTHAPAG